jgi:hypothetical protein
MHVTPRPRIGPDGTWLLFAVAIGAVCLWLLVLAGWPGAQAVPGPLPAPAPGLLPL